MVGSLFCELYPRVMISSTNTAYNLTIANTASPSYTLKVMTVVAVVFFPIVLVYQAWGYHIFRKRLSVPRVGGDESDVGGAAGAAAGGVNAGRDLIERELGAEVGVRSPWSVRARGCSA